MSFRACCLAVLWAQMLSLDIEKLGQHEPFTCPFKVHMIICINTLSYHNISTSHMIEQQNTNMKVQMQNESLVDYYKFYSVL